MALDSSNLAPIVHRGPSVDRPDPATVNAGDLFLPDGIARIDVAYNVDGVRGWRSVSGSSLSVLTDPTFYVDPVTGSDSNAGTITSPFATIDHALQALSPGWYGLATIRPRAGTSTIGNRTVFPSPLGNSSTTAGGLLIDGPDSTDSGLGTRTSNGGTTGTTSTFGTAIDSAGGLTVNAWRGAVLRFTSGATLSGRSFLIAKNSATTFTICGTLPVAPTTETFVVETPAAVITWSGTQVMQGSSVVGAQNLSFVGAGGTNGFRWGGFTLGLQRCRFTNIGTGGLQPRNNAGLIDLIGIQNFLGTTSITQTCGSYFSGCELQIRLGSASGLGPAQVNLSRSIFENADIELLNSTQMQLVSCYFIGNSWLRVGYGAVGLLASCRFEAVTPAPDTGSVLAAFGAAVVFSKRAAGVLSNCDISDTPATSGPGDGVFIDDHSLCETPTLVGTGNAGVGVRVRRLSQLKKSLGTTVTGTLGDVKVGDLAIQAWGSTTVLVTDPTELCLCGPNVG